jgi:hypothetical protein
MSLYRLFVATTGLQAILFQSDGLIPIKQWVDTRRADDFINMPEVSCMLTVFDSSRQFYATYEDVSASLKVGSNNLPVPWYHSFDEVFNKLCETFQPYYKNITGCGRP